MTQEPPKNNSVLIVIAIIGVIGTIIASAIGAIANYNIEKERQGFELTRIALVSIATQGGVTQMVLESTINAPTQQRAIDTLLPPPTNTTLPTAIPTETPVPDTPPNVILEVGQTWRANGLELTLESTRLSNGNEYYNDGPGIVACFRLANRRSEDLSLRYSSDNFVSQDNLGNRLKTLACEDCGDSWYEVTIIIRSGENIGLGLLKYNLGSCQFVEADITNPSVTELMLTVSGISSINNASWRVPIPH